MLQHAPTTDNLASPAIDIARYGAYEPLSTSVMILDNCNVVTYMNPAAVALMRDAASDISKVMSNFQHHALLGKDITNTLLDSETLRVLQTSGKHTITFGYKMFALHASVAKDPDTLAPIGIVVEWHDGKTNDMAAQLEALHRVQAVIEFNMDGTIRTANSNFLHTVGYSLADIQDKHHRMFVKPDYAASAEYASFWAELNQGNAFSKEYCRVHKNGSDIWIMASYNPVFDDSGTPYKVIKFATNITEQVESRHESERLITQTLANVQGIAAATDEMSSSVSEISHNMTKSKQAVDEIERKTNAADEASQNLQHTSSAMKKVIELIREIAGQVNLLALNATIEAARAGEAGRGFAVVASEVKNLANATTKATNDIAQEIKQMHDVVGNVTSSISEIKDSSQAVNQYVTAVAGAIEEQTAVTNDISQNVQNASHDISIINESIKRVSKTS